MDERGRSGEGTIFTAKRFLPRPDIWVEGGGLFVVDGRIERVFDSEGAARRFSSSSRSKIVDLGEVLVAPGMINAHAHLELSALAQKIPPATSMLPWIQRVIELRGELESTVREQAACEAALALTRTGSTTVGDIDSSGGDGVPVRCSLLRRVAFRELLDGGDAKRRQLALASIDSPLEALELRLEGLSPHAPHTVSPELMKSLAELARKRRLPVQVHWSETREELDWLAEGSGPFAQMLSESPMTTGLDLLERSGLLETTLSLVHGNFPESDEPARLAASGVVVVHCPGSHAYFDREPFPIEAYRRAGVELALGTDSLASNLALDMRREMQLLRRTNPTLEPTEVWGMATLGGARALGLGGRIGELSAGARADFACFESTAGTQSSALDELTSELPEVKATWIGGVSVLD